MQIVDKEKPKVNCIVFHGESNSGKSMMLQSVYDAFKAGGIVTNSTSCGFTWQECIDCRVILNEEALIAPTQTEEYKQIMSGTACMVNVKCRPQRLMERTPLLFTCNKFPWELVGENQVYENRCIIYRDLNQQSWLHHYSKRIHPKAWLYYINGVMSARRQRQLNSAGSQSPGFNLTLPVHPELNAQSPCPDIVPNVEQEAEVIPDSDVTNDDKLDSPDYAAVSPLERSLSMTDEIQELIAIGNVGDPQRGETTEFQLPVYDIEHQMKEFNRRDFTPARAKRGLFHSIDKHLVLVEQPGPGKKSSTPMDEKPNKRRRIREDSANDADWEEK